ncbi:LuxR C-terminal-related transcriptional regulator [Chimaeribacter arupi]|uniref:LuxR C-terminal-related transcriptional regulator n=1 Tax=Chimaeribacter arupi TaxID=2060066 RepID=UPI002711F903|nr:LuxR C-terminal-related transcriptional regulator [Chimaeribacter arupi]WKZ92907.1 LuxR C-terminal-related transcriptional regulator [Chimaeribacter arupi]
MPYKIIIAGDNPIIKYGLTHIINEQSHKTLKVVNTILLKDIYHIEEKFDLLLASINAPEDMFSIHLPFISRFYERSPGKKLAMITGIASSSLLLKSRKYLNGLLSERDPFAELIEGILKILEGQNYVSRSIREHQFIDKRPRPLTLGTSRLALSECEDKVIKYIFSGYNVTETARLLDRSIKTVSAQKRQAMKKLGVENDTELLLIVSQFSYGDKSSGGEEAG